MHELAPSTLRLIGTPEAMEIARKKHQKYMLKYRKAKTEQEKQRILDAQERIKALQVRELYLEELAHKYDLIRGSKILCKQTKFKSFHGGIGYAV